MERFTYRYRRNRQTYENHYLTQGEAESRAVHDVETLYAAPVCIKGDGRVILSDDDIMDLWQEKYLDSDEKDQ